MAIIALQRVFQKVLEKGAARMRAAQPGGRFGGAWVVVLTLCAPLTAYADPGAFSVTGLAGWTPQTFRNKAPTQYRLAPGPEGSVLDARCAAGASGLIWRERIDLARTPLLRWRWRVDGVYAGLDERTEAGDDFPARVYAVRDGGWAPWRTRSLVYVWASSEPAGSDWRSAYTDQAHIVALRSGAAEAGQWREERRDLRADFQRYFGLALDHVDGIALMSDCDDGGRSASAAYGDLRLERP